VKTRLTKLARNVKMPGFRPGKVPLKMVAQTYGAQVHAEVLNDKVGEAFSSAVTASKLRVAGTPRLEPRTVEGSSDLAFSATFEIYPEVTLGDLSNAVVERAVCPVTDAEVDRTLDIMRKQRATYEAGRPRRPGGRRCHGRLQRYARRCRLRRRNGGTDFKFTLGDGRMLPEFDTAVSGMTAGETQDLRSHLPSRLHVASELAGQTRAVCRDA
jgi:trigger factor